MENSASKEFKKLKVHFKYIKKTYNTQIPYYKYKATRSAIILTLQELENLAKLLSESSCR